MGWFTRRETLKAVPAIIAAAGTNTMLRPAPEHRHRRFVAGHNMVGYVSCLDCGKVLELGEALTYVANLQE